MKSWMKIVLGLSFGMVVGLAFSNISWLLPYSMACSYYTGLVGKVFIDLLKMLVGVLIFSSLVSGICHINDPKKLGRMGVRAFSFFTLSTLVAIGVGVFFASWLKPGSHLNLAVAKPAGAAQVNFIEFLVQVIPSNPIAAFAEGNTLQIIFFATLFALAVIIAQDKGKPVLKFIESLADVMQTMTKIVMKMAPYGVFALIASAISSIGLKVIKPLLWVLVCNYGACLFQILVIFCLVIKCCTSFGVGQFFKGMKNAIIVAFTTCSSAATLPVSLRCMRKKLGVPREASGFIMTLGSTVNMNGAAIGQAVACLFIAQAYNIELSALKIVVLFFTALVSAIGAAGVPGSGLIMLSIVLNAVGLPLEGIGLVAAIDRLREMLATVTNILGDAVATAYVVHKEKQIEERRLAIEGSS